MQKRKQMKIILTILLCFAIKFGKLKAQLPKVFIVDATHLMVLKNKVKQKDKATIKLVNNMKREAEALLKMKPLSVMDKESTPASGNKHDYMSQAPYFWYDSTKPNGLPYMRKDGQRNPEIYKITDHKYLGYLDHAVQILSLTYYLTGEEKFADKAAALLKHWFLDESSKMNPDLDYAQAIPGKNNGRGIGIIETRALTGIADAAGLLSDSKAWTNTDATALKQWYAQFLDWMLTSKNGKDEHKARNNHGSWFLVQATDFALFTGNKREALILSREGKAKIDSQVTGEGKMPLELARTNALGYSTFNLNALFTLAILAEKSGVDLWHYKNASGAGLQTAINWLMPYATGEKKWNYRQIINYNKKDLYPLLVVASGKYKDQSYLNKANELREKGPNALDQILYKAL